MWLHLRDVPARCPPSCPLQIVSAQAPVGGAGGGARKASTVAAPPLQSPGTMLLAMQLLERISRAKVRVRARCA